MPHDPVASRHHAHPHTATSVKDFLGSVLVLEPLMHYAPDANLVTEIPSKENGGGVFTLG